MGRNNDFEYFDSRFTKGQQDEILEKLARGWGCYKICRWLVGLGWLFVPCLFLCYKLRKQIR